MGLDSSPLRGGSPPRLAAMGVIIRNPATSANTLYPSTDPYIFSKDLFSLLSLSWQQRPSLLLRNFHRGRYLYLVYSFVISFQIPFTCVLHLLLTIIISFTENTILNVVAVAWDTCAKVYFPWLQSCKIRIVAKSKPMSVFHSTVCWQLVSRVKINSRKETPIQASIIEKPLR